MLIARIETGFVAAACFVLLGPMHWLPAPLCIMQQMQAWKKLANLTKSKNPLPKECPCILIHTTARRAAVGCKPKTRMLLIGCFAMLAGALLGGFLPLMCKISPIAINWMSVFGGGVLIGSVLQVILPEGAPAARRLLHAESFSPLSAGFEVWHEGIEHSPEEWWGGWAGLTVLFGFSIMIAVDHFAHMSSDVDSAAGVSAFAGLVLHAAADGIAVGVSAAAAAVSSNASSASNVEFTILLAIMLHKVPASLGLGSKLLLPPNRGQQATPEPAEAARRRRHLGIAMLIVFALASPLAALATYALTAWGLPAPASQEGLSPAEAQGQAEAAVHAAQPWLGLTFLFAGGTFLHVAVTHGLPAHSHGHSPGGSSSGYTPVHTGQAVQNGTHSPSSGIASPSAALGNDSDEELPLMGRNVTVPPAAAVQATQTAEHGTPGGASGHMQHLNRSCTASIRASLMEARAGHNGAAAREICCGSSAVPLALGICLPVVLALAAGAHHHH